LVDTERVEGGIRVYVDENGERWYCAHDVCQLTGHVNMSDAFSLRRGRAKFYDRIKLPTANGRGRANMVYIKAATVVELIGKSVKPHAASLMDWFVEVAK
jgi:prophage antirepressor-like protein